MSSTIEHGTPYATCPVQGGLSRPPFLFFRNQATEPPPDKLSKILQHMAASKAPLPVIPSKGVRAGGARDLALYADITDDNNAG